MDDDEALAGRLSAALHRELGSGDVDLGPVLTGARAGAASIRRRRTAGVGAAAALALAIPVGVAAWTGVPLGAPAPASSQVAAQPPPSSPAPSGSPTPSPTTPTTPTTRPAAAVAPEVDLSTLGPTLNAYEVPETSALRSGDFPVPVELLDQSTYRNVSVVPGQMCGDGPGLRPATALSQQFAEEDSNRFDQLAVSLQITGWSRGEGEAAFMEVRDDTGRCQWLDAVEQSTALTSSGQQALTLTRRHGELQFWVTVVRVEDLLVAVETAGVPEGGGRRGQVSQELANLVAERLRADGAIGSAGP